MSSVPPIGSSTGFPVLTPDSLVVPRKGIEYVRPGGFWASWKRIATSICHGSQPVLSQAGFAMATSAWVNVSSIIAYTLEPPSVMAVPAFSTLCLGTLFYFLGYRGMNRTRENLGILFAMETVAGNAYRITHPQTGETQKIAPEDPVLELHVCDEELVERLQGIPKNEIPAAFADMLQKELTAQFSRLQAIAEQSGAKALRLWTNLNPKYFKGFEPFEVKEVRLSEKTPERPSWFSRWAAKLIKRTTEIRLAQVVRNLYFRPWKKWHKTYPTRTYLIVRDDFKEVVEIFRKSQTF